MARLIRRPRAKRNRFSIAPLLLLAVDRIGAYGDQRWYFYKLLVHTAGEKTAVHRNNFTRDEGGGS